MKYYAGIGSRQTPEPMLLFMTAIAQYLDKRGYALRSGGADGADLAFERGARHKEIFLPWKGFNGSKSPLYLVPEKALKIAEEVLPEFPHCTPAVQKLKARNMMQVLGPGLDDPCDFVICWTEDGALRGGTAAAIRLAKKHQIRVFNLGLEADKEYVKETLRTGGSLG